MECVYFVCVCACRYIFSVGMTGYLGVCKYIYMCACVATCTYIYLNVFSTLDASGNLHAIPFLGRGLSQPSPTTCPKPGCKRLLQGRDGPAGHHSWALLPSSDSSAEHPALAAASSSEFPAASESTLERLNLRSGYWLLSKGMRCTQSTWVFRFPF